MNENDHMETSENQNGLKENKVLDQTDPNARENPAAGVNMHELAEEIATIMATKSAAPVETEQEKAQKKAEEAKAAKRRRRKQRRKNFRDLLLRIVFLAVVLYVLFFKLVGVLTMPNGDMYPRVDAGDLILYYRLDKDVRAQDIIVFQKDSSTLQEYVDTADAELFGDSEEDEIDETEVEEASTGETVNSAESSDVIETSEATEAPETAQTYTPSVQTVPDVAPSTLTGGNDFMSWLNRTWYFVEDKLGLRTSEGKQVFVCRVIATAGDTVEITENGAVLVNGNSMSETNIFYNTVLYEGFTQYPLTLQDGECFVLADRRNEGADSRFFGPVREDEIMGTVFTILRRNNL